METQVCPSGPQALVALLKACARQKDLNRGSKLHSDIAKSGLLKRHVFLGSALVTMYAKCGSLEKAQQVFEELPIQDLVSWSALMAGYMQHGHSEQALKCFDQMQREGLCPDAITYICILKACGSIGAAEKGKEIHSDIVRVGLLEKDHVVGTALVDMYAKCGLVLEAQEVFSELPVQDVVSWNVLMAGYTQQKQVDQTLECFNLMRLKGLSPDSVTYICILKACGSMGAADKGKEIHADIVKEGFLEKDIAVGNALIDMYVKCGLLAIAQAVFDELPVHDVISWSILISGYTQYGHGDKALTCFEQMQCKGHSPNVVTYICVLKACGSIGAAIKGEAIHAEIERAGLLKKDTVVGNTLLDMYAKCGLLSKAQEVFDELPVKSVVSWNALMAGYVQHGYGEQALNCYEQMKLKGFFPVAATYVCILKACGTVGALGMGKDLHAEIARRRSLNEDLVVGTALVDMYAKCGLLAKAQEVFDELSAQDVVVWSALIAGYTQHGHGEQALKYFKQMQCKGIFPNVVTYGCILKACGSIGAAEKGKEVHADIVREGLLANNMVLCTAMVDMYAKCGLMAKAQEVFDEFPIRNIALWNALMAGYTLLGKARHVFLLFDKMIREGIIPDMVTFTIMLNACSHSGLVDKGTMYFEAMRTTYEVIPTLEHHTGMFDLFARAGLMDMAIAVIKHMPFSANLRLWLMVLGACQKWGNVKLGQLVFEHVVQLDEKEALAYVCMSNIYAATGKGEDSDEVEAIRIPNQAQKSRHCWWNGESALLKHATVLFEGS